MSRLMLGIVMAGLTIGACLLARSIIAAQRSSIPQPPAVLHPPVAKPPLPAPTVQPLIKPEPPIEPLPGFTMRGFGQEQLAGPPDTLQGGDVSTAWAAATSDGQNEWLELTYAEPVQPMAVFVYENYGPGALAQIELYNDSGDRVTVWGDDPKPVNALTRIVNAPVEIDFPTQRIRLSILSALVPGWNEIDAVGLLDRSGRMHWVVAATASSSYAGDSSEPLPAQ